jgi:16S rRNA (guanine(966)-N(2))-methyltransferase RsmD
MDRVKEACFSILGRGILDSRFLDLFAGTGSVGIEALSRGATMAVFVENDAKAIQTIQTNLQATRLNDKATIRRADVFRYLKKSPDRPYDYIYIAPPQYQGLWQAVLIALDQEPAWTNDETTIIVQIDPSEQEAIELQRLEPYDERRYGKTLLWFFSERDKPQED